MRDLFMEELGQVSKELKDMSHDKKKRIVNNEKEIEALEKRNRMLEELLQVKNKEIENMKLVRGYTTREHNEHKEVVKKKRDSFREAEKGVKKTPVGRGAVRKEMR